MAKTEAKLTENQIDEMLADREAENVLQTLMRLRRNKKRVYPKKSNRSLSNKAKNLIVAYESGGKSYYKNVIKERAHWPKYSSGVTIGFGYDLGYNVWADAKIVWQSELGAQNISRLKPAIGLSSTEPNKAEKIKKIKSLVISLKDIVIPWDMAERNFIKHTAPRFVDITENALPNCAALSDDSFGALVSLVFNRGPSFKKQGERYKEMRAILTHMKNNNFDKVPAEIRSMKRIWASAGLKQRREDEAALFESGL